MVDKNILVIINKESYENTPASIVTTDWRPIAFDYNGDGVEETYIQYELDGFQATAYINETSKEVVIAYTGTNDIKDWKENNFKIAMDNIPSQFNYADDFYNLITKKHDGYKITVTGHSLGGAYAQLIGAKYDVDTVTFNAPGVAHLLPLISSDFNLSTDPKSYTNITNYNIANEWLNELNIGLGYQLLGTSYILPGVDKNIIDAHNDFKTLKSEYSNAILYEVWANGNKDKCNQLRRDYNNGSIIATGIVGILPGGVLLSPYIRAKTRNRLSTTFTEAQSAEVPRDPLLIDLDGDGIETTTVENGVYFDHESDGFEELSMLIEKKAA